MVGGVAELADVAEALRLAAKVDYSALTGAEAEASAEAAQAIMAQAAAVAAATAGAYDTSMQWSVDGHRSCAAALRHRRRMHGGAAASVVKLARALRRMPATELALADGAITEHHARRLAKASNRPEFAEAEALLLEHAATLSFRDFQRAVAYWEQVVDDNRRDPDDPEPPDPRELKRTAHASRTISEMTRVDAWLDPIGGEAFRESLRRIEQEFFDADWALAKQEHGEAGVMIDRLWRTPAQRRADALVEMAHRAATAPKDGKRPLPLVIIHTDVDTFETALARVVGTEPPAPLGTERQCETDDGVVISPTQMIEQALLGHVRRLVYEAPGVILDYGRKQRLFTGELRQAIQARDRTCDHAGCEIPARQCEIDHIQPWMEHGPTGHRNGRARCSFHHRNHRPRPG